MRTIRYINKQEADKAIRKLTDAKLEIGIVHDDTFDSLLDENNNGRIFNASELLIKYPVKLSASEKAFTEAISFYDLSDEYDDNLEIFCLDLEWACCFYINDAPRIMFVYENASMEQIEGFKEYIQIRFLDYCMFNHVHLTSLEHLKRGQRINVLCLNAIPGSISKEPFEYLTRLKQLLFKDCKGIQDLGFLKDNKLITSLSLIKCQDITSLTGISSLNKLELLEIQNSHRLTSLNHINNPELQLLYIDSCNGIKGSQKLSNNRKLEKLYLYNCSQLDRLPDFSNCDKINHIDIKNCESLDLIETISQLPELISLKFNMCRSLRNIKPIAKNKNLISLELKDCGELVGFSDLNKLKGLKSLTIENCGEKLIIKGLNSLSELSRLVILGQNHVDLGFLKGNLNLEVLDLRYCRTFKNLDAAGSCLNLKALILDNVNSLNYTNLSSNVHDISFIKNLQNLQQISLERCNNITHLSALSNCSLLKGLWLKDCKELADIEGIRHLRNLKFLDLSGCKKVVNLEPLFELHDLTELYDTNGQEHIGIDEIIRFFSN